MAEWWAQGLITELLSDSPLAIQLRQSASFHIVPNMNPDGGVLGHLRTNAVGANLNREWGPTGDHQAPTAENSPEVLCVLAEVDRVGCDFFMDVHGDEELPHIFLAGTQGIPNWSDRLAELYTAFVDAQHVAFPAFQKVHGYGNDEPSGANLAICGDQIAHRFDCLSMTLEMPYKDTWEDRHSEIGWSPIRCEQLGASCLQPLQHVLPFLRSESITGIRNGLRDEGPLPEWAVPSYENPPSEHCWDTQPVP